MFEDADRDYPNPEGKGVIITLTSDFGTQDGYSGSVKGVVYSGVPGAKVVDIAHEIPPHDLVSASLALEAAVPYYPPGTIHIVVVDPGVGGPRKIICVKTEKQYLIAPDNGVLSFPLENNPIEKIYEVKNVTPPMDFVSTTFHARDIFAPAAVHLARGGTMEELGDRIQENEIIRHDIPSPIKETGRIAGQVIHIDNFGNLITTIKDFLLDDIDADKSEVKVHIGKTAIDGISDAYHQAEPESPIALFGSTGRLEIAIYRGRGADFLGVDIGQQVEVKW